MKITDEMKRLAAECAERIGADGLTVWQADGEDLVALFNPLEPEIEGLRQTIRRGLISQVFLTGQPIIERDPATNPAHDTTIDHRTGRRCRTVMAAPWSVMDGSEGVVSAVLFAGGGSGAEFGLVELGHLADLARCMEEGGDG